MNCCKRGTWVYPTVLLCVYGFFSMMRPSEPFLTPYLTGSYKNLTIHQVSRQVYPVWTYSNFVILIPCFLLTDYLRYKPVIILQGLGYIATWLLLLFAPGVLAMQFMQATYGIVTASEVGYYSYIYSVISLKYYQRVTSYCRSITLVGYTCGSVLGQLLVSLGKVHYFYLNVISLTSVSIAFLTSLWLPMPQHSLFFHRRDVQSSRAEEVTPNSQIDGENTSPPSCGPRTEEKSRNAFVEAVLALLVDFKECYSSRNLIYWSLWWALATCGYYQISNYVQVLWHHKLPSKNFTLYNGGVEAVATLTGAAASFAVGHVRLDWSVWGELALGLFSCLNAGSVYLMDMTGNIWVCYACYVVFKSSYMQLITICTFQIAKNLTKERYALIFGVNTFVAVALQSILTAVVINTKSLNLSIMTQYFIYGSYFAVIALIFLGRGIYTVVYMKCIKKEDSIAEGSLSERDADLPENI
ncbi:thiamine transporter 2-like isoform X2 [Amia ocellicauda]|uniref:thiamine transporter 2-like isoform X2 n=1 Tax=Amia ocellicauda TaxID=2972642 RepID=UPI003463B72F